MCASEPMGTDEFSLTPEHEMLLQMRDTLYEGSWADFVRDLQARAAGQPHVFDTIPETPGLRDTVVRHLELIKTMQAWETEHGVMLKPKGSR